MSRFRGIELKKHDISPEQAGVLVIVASLGDNATPSEISRWLLRKPHTLSSIINQMVNKGLINKDHHPKQKNMVIIILTKNLS